MLVGCHLTGLRVLDIGSALGGVDLLLATQHGAAEVIGIDVEPQLIASADLADRIKFRLVEPGPLPFEQENFDAVFSKDAMVHIEDKDGLFAEVVRVLRPGGMFIASDPCASSMTCSYAMPANSSQASSLIANGPTEGSPQSGLKVNTRRFGIATL